jgi:hypothetical protein
VLVSCGKTGCLLGSKSEQSEKEGNSRKKREIDGKAVKTSSRAAIFEGTRLMKAFPHPSPPPVSKG